MKKLKTDLLSMFRDIDPSRLSRLGSSNCSESFNNTLRSKVPKDKHYSESGSLAYILSAAVCQKNEGSIRDRDVQRKREISKTK